MPMFVWIHCSTLTLRNTSSLELKDASSFPLSIDGRNC